MAAVIHEYDRTVVIRVHTRVYDDGTVTAQLAVDSDMATRDDVLATLVRAQFEVAASGGVLHATLDTSSLPPVDWEG